MVNHAETKKRKLVRLKESFTDFYAYKANNYLLSPAGIATATATAASTSVAPTTTSVTSAGQNAVWDRTAASLLMLTSSKGLLINGGTTFRG